jgi:hypothetical protein
MVIDREVEAKTDDISNNHGSVTQSESFETVFDHNPSDFLSVSELPVDRGLGSALQEVEKEGYRSVHTIIIKINKFGSGFNQIEDVLQSSYSSRDELLQIVAPVRMLIH